MPWKMTNIGLVGFLYIWQDFYSHKLQGIKYPFNYKYVSSVINHRYNIPENNNPAKLLKDVNNKITVFEVTEID